MTTQARPYKVTIRATSRRELDSMLDAAVSDGINQALNTRSQGMLITRHDYATVSVELSREVPFGTTIERDQVFTQAGSTVSTQ